MEWCEDGGSDDVWLTAAVDGFAVAVATTGGAVDDDDNGDGEEGVDDLVGEGGLIRRNMPRKMCSGGVVAADMVPDAGEWRGVEVEVAVEVEMFGDSWRWRWRSEKRESTK